MKKKALWAAMAALSLMSCTDMPDIDSYTSHQKPVIVPATIQVFGITALKAYRTPDKPGMIWVQPTTGRGLAMAASGRSPQWAAMREEMEPAYRNAALTAITGSGEHCEILTAIPWPTLMGFEFSYRCGP